MLEACQEHTEFSQSIWWWNRISFHEKILSYWHLGPTWPSHFLFLLGSCPLWPGMGMGFQVWEEWSYFTPALSFGHSLFSFLLLESFVLHNKVFILHFRPGRYVLWPWFCLGSPKTVSLFLPFLPSMICVLLFHPSLRWLLGSQTWLGCKDGSGCSLACIKKKSNFISRGWWVEKKEKHILCLVPRALYKYWMCSQSGSNRTSPKSCRRGCGLASSVGGWLVGSISKFLKLPH